MSRTRSSDGAIDFEHPVATPAPLLSKSLRARRAFDSGHNLAEPLQQIDRSCVLYRGRKLAYFAGCDYLRLASHPAVLQAVHEGLDRFGLNVAASRKTTGNHQLYGQLETALAEFFGSQGAVLVSSGYMTNLAVAQALAGQFTLALIDERSHGCLADAAKLLDCPVVSFPHRDPAAVAAAIRRAGRRSRLLLITDGLFSHSGEVAPLDAYLRHLPESAMLLVDDAHGAGILGRNGRGTVEHLGVPNRRIIQTVTLSKAFGVYGGAVIGTRDLCQRVIARSRLFAGNTPLPLPLAAACLVALRIVRSGAKLRGRLRANTEYLKHLLAEAGRPVIDGPGPILPIRPRDPKTTERLRRQLLAVGIHPPLINYLGGPDNRYFRFVVCSEHTPAQLQTLADVLISPALQQAL